jgi:hypothetical protein
MWDNSYWKKSDVESTCYNTSAALMIMVKFESPTLEYKINIIVSTSERSQSWNSLKVLKKKIQISEYVIFCDKYYQCVAVEAFLKILCKKLNKTWTNI